MDITSFFSQNIMLPFPVSPSDGQILMILDRKQRPGALLYKLDHMFFLKCSDWLICFW